MATNKNSRQAAAGRLTESIEEVLRAHDVTTDDVEFAAALESAASLMTMSAVASDNGKEKQATAHVLMTLLARQKRIEDKLDAALRLLNGD